MTKIQVIPDGHIIASIAAQNLTHATALAEWIDNSFDANADSVTIEFDGRKSLRIIDDGDGKDDLLAFARLGRSEAHKTTRSGTYGIGSKDAALWYGGQKSKLAVQSTKGEVRRILTIDWQAMQSNWEIEPPTEFKMPDAKPGTVITVSPIADGRHIPSGKSLDDLAKKLGYIYTPALRDGKQIKLRVPKREPILLKPWALPQFIPDSVIRSEFNVAGKKARIKAGIVATGFASDHPGITYFHGFRVIKPSSGAGCGSYDFRRVCGVVEIIGQNWTRSKNKDDIVSADALYEEVEKILQPILERAQTEGVELRHQALTKSVEAMVNATLAPNAKEKRDPGDTHGTVTPKHTDRKRRRASKTQPGDSLYAPRSGSVKVVFGDFPVDDGSARVLGNVVELNQRSPIVAASRDTGNDLAICILTLVALAHDFTRTDRNGQTRLRGFDDESRFDRVLGSLMAQFAEMNGRRVDHPLRLVETA